MKSNKLSMTVVLLLASLSSLGAVEWYRSAANGVPGASLSSGPVSGGWSLSINRSDGQETRSLFLDGNLESTTLSIRSAGRLIAREERNALGSLISRVEYAYDAEGNPRAIFIGVEDSFNGLERIATQQNVSADSNNLRSSDGSGGDWHITEYDESRNPVNRTVLEDGSLTEKITWNRDTEGLLREEVKTRGSDITRSLYDSEGRLQEETHTRNGAVILLRSYRWNVENLIRVEERGEGRVVVRELTWSGDSQESEKRSIDGETISETFWTGGNERTEVLYRDGVPVIRVLWSGNSKIREEFLKDGEIIRIREATR